LGEQEISPPPAPEEVGASSSKHEPGEELVAQLVCAMDHIPRHGWLEVGETRPEVIDLIEGSVTRSTIIHDRVRTHYRQRHPETQQSDIEKAAIRTLMNPDRAMVDLKYRNTVNVFRRLNDAEDVMVSLEISADPGKSNRIKSIRTYPRRRTEELLTDKRRVGSKWPEGGSATPAGAETDQP